MIDLTQGTALPPQIFLLVGIAGGVLLLLAMVTHFSGGGTLNPHLNVKIGATHGGISVGEDGASHQCCEDFALMRSIPGMVVMSPADDVEARAMVKAAYEHRGPVYMRFSRYGAPVIHDAESYRFEIGKGEVLRDGTDAAIIANGLLTAEALTAADILAEEGISVRVINMATIKPLDEELVLKAARDCGKIVTCEEHSIIGGLGEAVCAVIAGYGLACPVRRVGVNDEFGHSGPAGALLEQFGLCGERIAQVVGNTAQTTAYVQEQIEGREEHTGKASENA